jgi:hypothetical protein
LLFFKIILCKYFCAESIALGKEVAGGPVVVLCRELDQLAVGIDGSTCLTRDAGGPTEVLFRELAPLALGIDGLAGLGHWFLYSCNTPCFCSVVICANDTLNYSSNYPWEP